MTISEGKKRVQYTLKQETIDAVKRDAAELGMTTSSYVNMVLLSVSRVAASIDADEACDAFNRAVAGTLENARSGGSGSE